MLLNLNSQVEIGKKKEKKKSSRIKGYKIYIFFFICSFNMFYQKKNLKNSIIFLQIKTPKRM